MFNVFKLNKEISRTTSDIDTDDVFKTKKEPQGLGYYTPNPKLGINEYTDEGLFSGISKLQKDNNLKVDEVMKPGGETEKKINEIKQNKEKNPINIFANKETNPTSNFRKDFEARKENVNRNEISRTLQNKEPEKIKLNGSTQAVRNIDTRGMEIPQGIFNSSNQIRKNEGVRYAQNNNTQRDVSVQNRNSVANERFNNLHHQTRREEGGYVEDPSRIEQPTNTGIIQPTLDGFRRNNPRLANNYPTNVRDLTQEQIEEIYRVEFFDRNNVGEIEDEGIRRNFYDFVVNHSPSVPRRALQEAINQYSDERVDVDGVIGTNTLNALNRASQDPEVARRISNHINDVRRDSWDGQPEGYRERFPGLSPRIRRVR